MLLWQAAILGLLQGLTEFIPISSTGHLTLAGKAMGLIDSGRPEQWTAFLAVVQFGTLVAVLGYFLPDIVRIVRGFLAANIALVTGRVASSADREQARLAWMVIVATAPIAVAGLLFQSVIEGGLTKNLWVIASSLVGLAVALWAAELIAARRRDLKSLRWTDACIVGAAQVFSLVPGSSRSGTTITGGLVAGLTRESAARFSFLVSIPAVAASGLFEAPEALRSVELGWLPLLVAIGGAAVSGYLAIAFLLRYLRRHSTYVFVGYRIALGLVVMLLLLSGAVTP